MWYLLFGVLIIGGLLFSVACDAMEIIVGIVVVDGDGEAVLQWLFWYSIRPGNCILTIHGAGGTGVEPVLLMLEAVVPQRSLTDGGFREKYSAFCSLQVQRRWCLQAFRGGSFWPLPIHYLFSTLLTSICGNCDIELLFCSWYSDTLTDTSGLMTSVTCWSDAIPDDTVTMIRWWWLTWRDLTVDQAQYSVHLLWYIEVEENIVLILSIVVVGIYDRYSLQLFWKYFPMTTSIHLPVVAMGIGSDGIVIHPLFRAGKCEVEEISDAFHILTCWWSDWFHWWATIYYDRWRRYLLAVWPDWLTWYRVPTVRPLLRYCWPIPAGIVCVDAYRYGKAALLSGVALCVENNVSVNEAVAVTGG